MQLRHTGIIIIIMLLLAVKVAKAEINQVSLSFENHEVDLTIRAVERDGRFFVNLPFVNYLNIVTARDFQKEDVFLKFGKTNIKLYANSPKFYIDQKSNPLPVAPYTEGGEFWLPLDFLLRLGLEVKKQVRRELFLGWDRNYLLGIESIQYHNRPAVLLIGSGELKTNPAVLEAGRLMLELPNTLAHFSLDDRVKNNPLVNRVRIIQTGDNLKLECDLNQSAGYRLIPDPENRNRLLIVFNYTIEELNCLHQNGENKITIKTSFPDDYQVITNSGHRLTIDFNAAVFKEGLNWPVNGDGEWIKSLQLTRIDSGTTRLEMELLKPGPLYVLPAAEDPNLLEIRDVHLITQVSLIQSDSGPQLIIKAGGDDNGACGRQGTLEKDNNLEIAMRLKDLLEEAGAAAVFTRSGDYFVGLYERAYFANYLSADLFISVHTNNHPDLNVRGIEVFHYQGRSQARTLATNVYREMLQSTGFPGLGVKEQNFVVIRETQMPGILVEVGFLSNFQEEKIIRTPEFKENAALGIFQGIKKYYEK